MNDQSNPVMDAMVAKARGLVLQNLLWKKRQTGLMKMVNHWKMAVRTRDIVVLQNQLQTTAQAAEMKL